ncbi:hypothetical protein SCAR479_13017 [Seiridium cardinale]|uniref:Uncharacterized protein n=1 Tax=Seiridium cardinale TaxID=138064 RepID=A0ABR2X9J7_9PEZI
MRESQSSGRPASGGVLDPSTPQARLKREWSDDRTMSPVDDFLVSGARTALSNGSFRICGKELPSALAIGLHSVCGPKLVAWMSP